MGYSYVVTGLTSLLKKGKAFEFNPVAKESFEYLKKYFAIKSIFYKANSVLLYILELDASFIITSGILSQKDPDTGELHFIAYYFKKFSPAELNYITQDQELLAIVFYLKHWRYYLEGALYPVTICINLNNLRNIITTAELNRRQARHLEEISYFNLVIKHRSGKTNPANPLL